MILFKDLKQAIKDHKKLNKYELTVKKIEKMSINYKKLEEYISSNPEQKIFWRNTALDCWCSSGTCGSTNWDYSSYWIGICDDNTQTSYSGLVKIEFTSMGDMCSYNINNFFEEKSIENDIDLNIQIQFINRINQIIDLGILTF